MRQQAAALESLKQLETQAQAQLHGRQQLESLLPICRRYEGELQDLIKRRETAEQGCLKGKANGWTCSWHGRRGGRPLSPSTSRLASRVPFAVHVSIPLPHTLRARLLPMTINWPRHRSLSRRLKPP